MSGSIVDQHLTGGGSTHQGKEDCEHVEDGPALALCIRDHAFLARAACVAALDHVEGNVPVRVE